MNNATQLEQTLREQMGKVLFGLDDILHGLSIAIIAQGHVLLEGAPGLGKTLLSKSLAQLLGGEFGRIQGTADLMPSDMTGIHVYDNDKKQFQLLPGPLFNKVVLMDEINRTGPKTQSAILQAMEENKITLDRKTYPLPEGFFIIASQNPLDFEGVYPLLESQLDRFLMRLDMNYPDLETEIAVLQRYDHPGGGHIEALDSLQSLTEGLIKAAQQEAEEVHVADSVYHYVATLAQTSRENSRLALGLSPRGALAMMRCARVEAAIQGRKFVTPDDIKQVAPMVVCHRLLPTSEAILEGINALRIYQEIESQVAVPRDLDVT